MPVSKPTKSSQTPSGPHWMHAERTNLWTLSTGGFFFSVYYVADNWHTVQIRDVFPNLCCIRMHFSAPDIYSALFLFKKKNNWANDKLRLQSCSKNAMKIQEKNNKKHNKTRIFKSNSNRSSCVMRWTTKAYTLDKNNHYGAFCGILLTKLCAGTLYIYLCVV